jgi:primosomal protein N' (replication factor Y) (superfamily II helicase)
VSSLSQCPQCKSYRLKNIGFGTEKISDELKTLFPKAKISTADQTVFQKNTKRENLFQAIKNKQVDILVGTQSVIKGFDFPQVGLAAIINSEKWGGKTDFRFDERWLGNLFQLAGRVNRPKSDQKGKLIIQTFQPENPLLEYLDSWKWESFAQQELANRTALKYPPACHLMKLICLDENIKKVEKNVKRVYNQVLKIESKQIIEVLAPYEGNIKKHRSKWQKNILIKTTNLKNVSLKKIIEKLPENWIIDINPENIF